MSTEEERKLFVAGLPESMSEDSLRQLFEQVGTTVVDVSLPRHRDTGRPRGFGFVTLATSDEANTARDALDGSLQSGRSISVRPFKSEAPKRDSHAPGGGGSGAGGGGSSAGADRTLYVGNIPFDATASEIEALIGDVAGGVVRVHLPMGPDGRPRGFGFVTMGSAESALAAVAALSGKELKGRRVMANIAHPRGERPAGGGPPPGAGDREPFAARRDDRPPPRAGFAPFGPPPPADPGRAPPDGVRREQRWVEKPEKKEKKKKRRGRQDAAPDAGREKRFAKGAWEEWDDD